MAMYLYQVGGIVYQYEEGEQPAGAVKVSGGTAQTKKAAPANKKRGAANK